MNHDQFSLPFLDTTSLGGGFGLYDGSSAQKRAGRSAPDHDGAGLFDTPVFEPSAPLPTQNPAPAIAAQDYRLAGDRRLAEGWKTRTEDNLAAIRLAAAIEAEGRHARPDEQEKLARFTAFGASDLADQIFRRASEGFRSRLGRLRPRTRAAGIARRSGEPSLERPNTPITRPSS